MKWPGFSAQKNFALARARGAWALSLDADERASPERRARLEAVLRADGPAASYRIPRRNIFGGAWVRHRGLHPDYQLRLFRRGADRFVDDSVHESVRVEGRVEDLDEPLVHHSSRDREDFAARSNRSSTMAARDWVARGRRVWGIDLVVRPLGRFLSMSIFRHGFLDSWRGLVPARLYADYVFFRTAKAWELGRAPVHNGSQ